MNPAIGLILGLVVGGALGYLLRRPSPGEGLDRRDIKVRITLAEEPKTRVARAQVCPDPAWVPSGGKVRWQVVNKCGGSKKAKVGDWKPARPGNGKDETNVEPRETKEEIQLDTEETPPGLYKYSVFVDGEVVLDPAIIIDRP